MTTSVSSTYSSNSSSGYSGTSTEATTQLSGDMETFMNLLVTQLKNQDPLSPMDSTEFTNQLVQYAQVEQTIQTNRNNFVQHTLYEVIRDISGITYGTDTTTSQLVTSLQTAIAANDENFDDYMFDGNTITVTEHAIDGVSSLRNNFVQHTLYEVIRKQRINTAHSCSIINYCSLIGLCHSA